MVVVHQSREFATWLRSIRDDMAAARIVRRLERVQAGATGDTRSLGAGLHELRIDHGPGYRIYFAWRGSEALVLLAGGTKGSQARDIRRAKSLAAHLDP
jgi:putative addiction module killer protein